MTSVEEKRASLESTLSEAGLDVEYWKNRFKRILGVSSSIQLKHLGIREFDKIKKSVRHEWEKNVLKQVFGISEESYDSYKKNEQNKVIKQDDDAKKLLQELKQMSEAGKKKTDNLVKEKEENLKALLCIPDEHWKGTYENLSFDDKISKLNSFIGDLDKILATRKILSPVEVLENASGGKALKGVMVTGDMNNPFELYGSVIKAPKNIKLRGRSMDLVHEVSEFSSKSQHDRFHRLIKTMGYSVAASVKAGGYGFHLEGGYAQKSSRENQKEVKSNSRHVFQSRVMHFILPTASVELNPRELKLTDSALAELGNLHKLIGVVSDEVFDTGCQNFIKKFGSHVCTGMIHFGGIYESCAVYSSEQSSQTIDARDIVHDVHSAFLEMGYKGFGFAAGVSVDYDQVKETFKSSKSYDMSEVKKVNMRVTQTGGPFEASAFPLWKTGLQMNETWAVIDCGNVFPKDFTGIWELISNHSGEFNYAVELAKKIQQNWLHMSRFTISKPSVTYEKASIAIEMGINWVERVKEWVREENLVENAVGYLQQLLAGVEQLCSETGSTHVWTQILERDREVADFLFQIVQLEKEYDVEKVEMIRYYLKQLLSISSDADYAHKDEIMTWANLLAEREHIPGILAAGIIPDVPSFLSAVKEKVLVEFYARATARTGNTHNPSDEMNSPNVKCTLDMSLVVDHVRNQLEKSEDTVQVFLLEIILTPLNYNFKTKGFASIITLNILEKFIEKAEDILRNFEAHKKMGKVQLQAFLFCLAEDILAWSENPKKKKEQFSHRIQSMKKFLAPELASVLLKYTSKSPCEWEEIFYVMRKLSEGETISSEPTIVDIPDLGNTVDKTEEYTQDQQDIKHEPSNLKPKATGLLETLHLSNWYPCKISLHEVMKIQKELPERDIQPSDLPWVILKKLMSINYLARDQEICNLYSLCQATDTQTNVSDDTDGIVGDVGLEVDIDNIVKEVCSEDLSAEKLNPLDVFITIFECCDLLLRQTLMQKMFMCRLAIPLIYPQLVQNSLMFSLWTLRTLVVEWKNNQRAATETSIVTTPISNVSFIRYGRPSLSKSKYLNSVLGSENNTFFNKDCPMGDSVRSAGNGLVEASWFIPSGKKTDPFQEVVMFLNLRGDATEHKKQFEVIATMSSIVILLICTKSMKDCNFIKMMKDVYTQDAKIIFILQIEGGKTAFEKVINDYQEAIGYKNFKNTKWISASFGGKEKNADVLKKEIQNKIAELLKVQIKRLALSSIDMPVGIVVDERSEDCLAGKKLADEIIQVLGDFPPDVCKEKMLPLQGKSWLEWSILLKKSSRNVQKGGSTTFDERDRIKQEMTALRKMQIETCQNLTSLVKIFINILKQVPMKTCSVVFCLQWLKIYLDNKSREVLPSLHSSYHATRTRMTSLAQTQDIKGQHTMQRELTKTETKLANSSLGLEHFFREIGQIYEAVTECNLEISPNTKLNIINLPRMVAKLLLNGFPLELMDGDAACVPLTWINAVFSSLKQLIGDKKVFVISILGIQSSGKSTMLNTMFGLQFAVSAGRCTRGVYLQLVKIDTESGLPFDYLFVVDTEGLRAPELGEMKHKHDNELATLVTGLGDVTIMNIKGENVSEMQDVLQITVHAFLRMKLVNKNIQLRKKCVFLHQNVCAVNAKEKMAYGTQKMQDTLDAMAKEAAAEEDISDVNTFNDVIDFDGQHHIWFISDLWKGDPPMSPVNPGYSEQILQVKEKLLHELSRDQESFLTVSDVAIRLKDLWNGVLADDFVFSFKNSLAVKAYNGLETKFSELFWNHLEHPLSLWLENTASNRIKQCNVTTNLEESCVSLVRDLQSEINTRKEKIKEELEKYFAEDNLKNILVQWKEARLISLKSKASELETRGREEISSKKEEQRIDLLQKTKYGEHIDGIMRKAKKHADEMKGKEINEESLASKFDEMWLIWMSECGTKEKIETVPVEIDIEKVLFDKFNKDHPILTEELKKRPLKRPLSIEMLKGSLQASDIHENYFTLKFSVKEKIIEWIPEKMKGKAPSSWQINPLDRCKSHVVIIADEILEHIDIFLTHLQKRSTNFKLVNASELINFVTDGVVKFNKEKDANGFTLLPTFTVMLAVHVCRHAIPIFEKMRNDYEQNHSAYAKLNEYRQSVKNLFRNLVKQSTNEVIAADILCDKIEVLMKNTIRGAINTKVVDKVVTHFSVTKFSLITAMLDDMALKANFDNYRSYIRKPKSFALNWVTNFTNENLFCSQRQKLPTYMDLVESHANIIIDSLEKGIEVASKALLNDSHPSINKWSARFLDNIKTNLPLLEDDLSEFFKYPIVDYQNFQGLLLQRIIDMKATVLNEFRVETQENIRWEGKTPYEQAADKLWGCEAVCPFCKEPCQRSDPKHASYGNDSHQCIQHRPQGIGGYHWRRSEKICTETCNYDVQSDFMFRCGSKCYNCPKTQNCDTSEERWHKYTNYKTFFPDWDISPSPETDGSKYWMWFLNKFKHQLAEMYQAKLPDIPGSWVDITLEQARESLRIYMG